jgi:transposase
MNEKLRNEIVQRYQAGTSMRRIARELQVARTTVRRVLGRLQGERSGATPASELRKPSTRPRVLDKHDAFIRQLLERYPNMTAVRVHEELHARGVCTSYTIVRERVRQLRTQP